MTIQRQVLPVIPFGVKVKLLGTNLKLFSDDEIALIKAQFSKMGKYHHYLDENGAKKKLKYTVLVFDGRYFAVYPGKKYMLAAGESSFGQVRVAQDLDTGEWIVDKAMFVHPSEQDWLRSDIEAELRALIVNEQAVVNQKGMGVLFHRPFKGGEFGKDDGKYDVLMKFASGMDLEEWMKCCKHLPLIVKLDMAIGLTTALMAVHRKGMLHRDVKLRNTVFDLFQPPASATKIVDFGFATSFKKLHHEMPVGCGTPGYIAPEIESDQESTIRYTSKSDIYALGATLGILLGFYALDSDAILHERDNADFAGDFALKSQLQSLFEMMLHESVQERPGLDDVLQLLQRLRNMLPLENRVLRGGVLDVSVWRDACAHGEKYELLGALKTYDYVQLADVAGTCSAYELLMIKRSLIHNFCITAGDVLMGSKDKIEMYADQTQQLVQDDGRIYQLNWVKHVPTLRLKTHDAEHAKVEDAAVEYDWSEYLGWFFGSIREDIARIMPAVPVMPRVLGFFGACSPRSGAAATTNLIREPLESESTAITMGSC